MSDPPSPRIPDSNPLFTRAKYLKGVGPDRAELLQKLELNRAVDFLFFFPRDYIDMTDRRSANDLEPGILQSVLGKISEWDVRETRKGTTLTELAVECDGTYVKGIWFNSPFWLRKDFAKGRRVLLTGKPKFNPPFWTISHPSITYLSDDEADTGIIEPFLPVYNLTEGVTQLHLRKIVRNLIAYLPQHLDEVFPVGHLRDHNLLGIHEAILAIHFPKNREQLAAAKRRFVYQELFILQLGLAIRRLQHRTHLKASAIEIDPKIDTRIRARFPFELTPGQNKVIAEISSDMARPIPMNRLLQGDVGSGKTIIAAYAMLLAAAKGFQSVFMAPTEVLARQHLRTFTRMLQDSKVSIATLFGGQKPTERAIQLQKIISGDAQIIIGTQAIISREIEFHKLGLIVIDEQHKFGVRQRAALKTGTKFDPHYLVMTATPIPRSVTMTLFGDLDVSLLDEIPPGRQKVRSYMPDPKDREKWWTFVRKKLDEGRQGFVVVPLVEESENWDASSLIEVYESLSSGELRNHRLGYIHGRMSNEEKERVMLDFRSGEIQVLVATTVIEVGVDVPNAALMTVESAERFGIAQLHQLRGRIGRGTHPGFCTIFANPQNEATEKRLKAFVGTNNGFKLAEKDFEIRGAGDLFGTQQHGLPPFMIADLTTDREILLEARNDAGKMVLADPGLSRPEHLKLRKQMLARYGKVLELGDVG